jgi:YhcH/YjgK/YiaL family protein
MIVDKLANSRKYYTDNSYYIMAIKFIEDSVFNKNIEDGDYQIAGDDVFARVMSYPLKSRDKVKYEAHKKYIDIQAAILGSEGIEWSPLDLLESDSIYDANNDVQFFKNPENSLVKINVIPGSFAMFFPEDGHMPQLFTSDNNSDVKKIVVKIRNSLLV